YAPGAPSTLQPVAFTVGAVLNTIPLAPTNTADQYPYDDLHDFLVKHLHTSYYLFRKQSTFPTEHYDMNRKLAVLAVTNAVSDIARSADYHSDTGPNDSKLAAFLGKWIAHQRPIQFDWKPPVQSADNSSSRSIRSSPYSSFKADALATCIQN